MIFIPKSIRFYRTLFILIIVSIAGCNTVTSSTDIETTNATIYRPTYISPEPTSILSASVGKPIPLPKELISLESINRLQMLAFYGKGAIKKVAFSPQGGSIAVATSAGVWLYDLNRLADPVLFELNNAIDDFVFRQDGERFVTVTETNNVSGWNTLTGKREFIGRLDSSGQENEDRRVADIAVLSPDGDLIATTVDENKVEIRKVDGQTLLCAVEGEFGAYDYVRNLVISPDNRFLALSTNAKDSIQVWDVNNCSHLHTLSNDQAGIVDFTFSPEISEGSNKKTVLAVSRLNQPVEIWQSETGVLLNTLGNLQTAQAMSFSSDSQLLAWYSKNDENDNQLQVWRIDDDTLVQTIQTKHTESVVTLAFSPDNERLISGSLDGTVQIWRITDAGLTDLLAEFNQVDITGPALSLATFFSNNELFVADPYNHRINLWNLETGQMAPVFTGHYSLITNLEISADKNRLASAELWDKAIYIWDSTTRQGVNIPELYIDAGYDKTLAISSDGRLVAFGDIRSELGVVYDVVSNEKLYFVEGRKAIFSADNQKIATVLQKANVYNAQSGQLLHSFDIQSSGGGLAFSPDGNLLAVGNRAGTVELWDITTGKLVRTLQGNHNKVVSVAYSPDGHFLTAGTVDPRYDFNTITPTILFWEVETGELIGSVNTYQTNIATLSFNPRGNLLVVVGLDGTVSVWGNK